MWAALVAALEAIPELIKLGQLLVQSIQNLVEAQKEANLLSKEKAASEKAATTKDTSDLENVFKGDQ